MNLSSPRVRPARRANPMRRRLSDLLAPAGATLDGGRPWDPQIHRDRAFARIARGGTLGAGEAYVDGDWDCVDYDLTLMAWHARFERAWSGLSRRYDDGSAGCGATTS
jgi:cyclopropane-fatty-acyl-phospholipid synthase